MIISSNWAVDFSKKVGKTSRLVTKLCPLPLKGSYLNSLKLALMLHLPRLFLFDHGDRDHHYSLGVLLLDCWTLIRRIPDISIFDVYCEPMIFLTFWPNSDLS